jgi:hypothetical protein
MLVLLILQEFYSLEYFHWRKVLFVVERSARAALRAEFELCAASQEAYQQGMIWNTKNRM